MGKACNPAALPRFDLARRTTEQIIMSELIFDVSEADFDAQVIRASHTQPVLVDFWADWCAPCRQLKPLLEKLVVAQQGRVVLAKVDVEAQAALASRYKVRGIPDVRAFVNGDLVDGFTGVMHEAALQTFIERLLPSPAEPLRLLALTARDEGNTTQAIVQLREAIAVDPQHQAAQLDLVELLADVGDADEAARLLKPLTTGDRHRERVEALRARVALASQATPGATGLNQLEAEVERAPDDIAARIALARACVARKDWEKALTHLLAAVQLDAAFENGAARKIMVQIFALPDVAPDLVRRYRRALASAINR